MEVSIPVELKFCEGMAVVNARTGKQHRLVFNYQDDEWSAMELCRDAKGKIIGVHQVRLDLSSEDTQADLNDEVTAALIEVTNSRAVAAFTESYVEEKLSKRKRSK